MHIEEFMDSVEPRKVLLLYLTGVPAAYAIFSAYAIFRCYGFEVREVEILIERSTGAYGFTC